MGHAPAKLKGFWDDFKLMVIVNMLSLLVLSTGVIKKVPTKQFSEEMMLFFQTNEGALFSRNRELTTENSLAISC